MSHSSSSPQISHQHVEHLSQSLSQTLRKRDSSEGILFVKDNIAKRSDSSSVLDSDVSSTKTGGRRPSVDTVSTYLSHESELRASTSHVCIFLLNVAFFIYYMMHIFWNYY